ncbi:unnamed protein product [Microthlaspi erraticum]|uniref:Uncharacterized protein n=1 Tax=Microthlaspi erraticum TaxID=1685480 RepID=A0A6D2J8L6_9BRAS|nr:unnamed protein product [Microthlaspi erraticum]
MASPAKFHCSRPTFHLQINLRRSSPDRLSFPLFSRDLPKSPRVRFPVVRASSPPSNPKPSLLKTTCITLTAAAALFSASFYFASKPPAISPEEATLEKHLETESNDVEALLSLTKIKFESKKYDQAIAILNRMIEIDPDEQDWPVMKARILSCNGESESAITAFEEILAKDPNRVEAYHYLVMECYDSIPKLTELEKKISDAIGRCKKKTKEIRDFRLLIAQIKVIEGNSVEAIRICEELVKDDPKDFRMYLFQGLMYTLMKNEDEAAKQYEQGAMFLPEDHPFRDFENNSESEWRVIVAYDSVFCYLCTFTKLLVASSFGKLF